MNIICPIDFSSASVNAASWARNLLLAGGGGKLQLVHCINIRSRANMFISLDEVFRKQAEKDMVQLIEALSEGAENIEITSHVKARDPKTYIAAYAIEQKADFVVVGTKGMTALKDVTVGSVTETLFKRSSIPVFAIPDGIYYKEISSIVLGVDDEIVKDQSIVQPLIDLVKRFDAKLLLAHVRQRGDSFLEYDPGLDVYFAKINHSYKSLEYDDSIAETLSEYCDSQNAQVLSLIHRKRSWFERIFHWSVAKSELFDFEQPLLVLPEK
jgi:nucleotide-binding universal stress UspA family protein